MSADAIGGLVNFGIMVAAGVYATLLGYRKIGQPPGQNQKVDDYHAKWGSVYRTVGPVLIVGGVVLGLVRAFGS